MEPQVVTSLLETGGYAAILGLVTWLVRRVFTHTIPRLAEDFKETLTKQQVAFLKQLEAQRIDFKDALAEQRDDFKTALKQDREQLGGKVDRLTDSVDRFISRKASNGGLA